MAGPKKAWEEWSREEILEWWERGRTYQEIADITGTTRGAVAGKVRRAKAARDMEDHIRSEPVDPREGNRLEFPECRLRGAVFDIETSNFQTYGYDGHLVAACVQPLDGSEMIVHALRFEEGRGDDRRVLYDLICTLNQFDILAGHNIKEYDLPYLNSRLMYWGMPTYRRFFLADTYLWAQKAKIKTRKRLVDLIGFFGIRSNCKTHIDQTTWSLIHSPFESEFSYALDYIIDHCREDVGANRLVLDALWRQIMTQRFSSSSPFAINDLGMGASVVEYEGG